MNRREFLQREAEGVAMRKEPEYMVNWDFDFNEDHTEEMRQERYEQRRRVRNLSCTDGFCGADDCPRCRPGSYRFAINDGED